MKGFCPIGFLLTRWRHIVSALTSAAFLAIGLLAVPTGAFCQADTRQAKAEPMPQGGNTALDLLSLTRKSVEKFFEQSANVVCEESINQILLNKSGKPAYREESRYVYQLEAAWTTGALKLKESREPRKVAFRDPTRTLLVTNGFASLLLIVHPNYEASYLFEPAGEQTIDGVTLTEIRFKPIPGGSSPAALQVRGRSYPLPLSGSIWIDKQSGAITRLTAGVDTNMSDLGLQEMHSDIHYAVVKFHDPDESYWLPVSATIDVETPRQHWRNIHRFTSYRRFKATIRVENLEAKQ